MRRTKLITILIFALAWLIAVVLASCGGRQKAKLNTDKPNVLFILTDDQGYGDLSCYGNPILKTPALDKLHSESIRFTDFHVSSICTPTRSQLLTGRDACRNGAFAWVYSREIIHEDETLMPEIFKANGYATGHFGKWHLGDNYPYRPMDRGFDESIKHGGASIYQTPDYWDNDYMDDHYEHNGKLKQFKGYCTDVWFKEAKKFILESKQKDKPFFIYLPTNAPHGPLIVHKKYSKQYLDILNKGFKTVPEFEKSRTSTEEISWFYGMLANLDENMVKLDVFLKENGLFENTILVFMSDNGGTCGVKVHNAGMRGMKTQLYDGGHRVPFFIRWPNGKFISPRNINQLTHSQDLLPTLIDLCELKYEKQNFDGVSLKELLMDDNSQLEERILVMQNARAPLPTKYDATIMQNKWRLVKNSELYNIKSDPGQQKNIIDDNPEIVSKMREHYEEWWNGIQESLNNVPYIPVGGEQCKKVVLTCFDWHGFEGKGNVTIQPTVRQGGSANGNWNVEILEDGEYEIRCSRWPEEAETKILDSLPPHKTLTITYPEGKAFPIDFAKIKVNEDERIIPVSKSDLYAASKYTLKKGKYVMRAAFFDRNEALVCGAYYAYLIKNE